MLIWMEILILMLVVRLKNYNFFLGGHAHVDQDGGLNVNIGSDVQVGFKSGGGGINVNVGF